MNTTVKEFIISNFTDDHFERLVHHLIIEDICFYEPEVADLGTAYLQQSRNYTEKNTFTVLQAIQELQKEDLNSLYSFVQKLPVAFLAKEEAELDIGMEAHEVTISNYQIFVEQELVNKAVKLIRFIYEVLGSQTGEPLVVTSEIFKEWMKLESNPDTIGRSHVEITDQAIYSSDYCVHILLDNRTRYLSAEAQRAYRLRWDDDIPVTPVQFVEFEILAEDLVMENEYRLEPFTHYLNEPITVPSAADEVIYNLLEQFISLLTSQGFTEDEQLDAIQYYDQKFDSRYM